MQNILFEAEEALFGVYDNFPVPGVGALMQVFTSPTGRCYSRPNDVLTRKVSKAITTDTKVRSQIAENIYIPTDLSERTALLFAALPKCLKADSILSTLKKERRQPSTQEKMLIDEAEAMREIIIQVDSFPRLGKELNEALDWTANLRPGVTVKAGMMAAAVKR